MKGDLGLLNTHETSLMEIAVVAMPAQPNPGECRRKYGPESGIR